MQQFASTECEPHFHVNVVQSEDDDVPTVHNETLGRQLEKLWKTDFGDWIVGTRTLLSVEDNKALTKIRESLQDEMDIFKLDYRGEKTHRTYPITK